MSERIARPPRVLPRRRRRRAPWWWPFGSRDARGSWEFCPSTLENVVQWDNPHRCNRRPHHGGDHRCRCGRDW